MAMQLNQVVSILCALLPAVWSLESKPSAHLQVRKGTRIDPELEPTSHDKFFGKDYPDDIRAPTFHHFDHPYPEIQDSDHYDKDYVQDENDDNGEWAAQWGYDSKKNKLMNEKEELQKALSKEYEEKNEWEAAVEAEKKAEAEARAAEKRLKEAQAHEDNMEKNHSIINATIDSKADEVEKEVKDLEECKKQLMKARKQLKALLEEKARAKSEEDEAEGLEDHAEDKEMSAEKREELAEKKVEEEHKEYLEAKSDVEKQKKDVERAKKDLEAAAKKLRKHRKADSDGGVYSVKDGVTGFTIIVPLAMVSLQIFQVLI